MKVTKCDICGKICDDAGHMLFVSGSDVALRHTFDLCDECYDTVLRVLGLQEWKNFPFGKTIKELTDNVDKGRQCKAIKSEVK